MHHLIDSHAHITFSQTTQENSSDPIDVFIKTEPVLERAKKSGVSKIINICSDEKALEDGLTLAKSCNWIYNAAALPPHDVENHKNYFFQVEKAAMGKKLIAIGETGLDYYYAKETKDIQISFLEKHIQLAKELNLPLIFHCRDAFQDLFSITKKYLPFPAVVHCFTGSLQEAKEALKNNWYISISGIVTFKNSTQLQSAVKEIPTEKLLIETDSPYLAPQKHRGKKNEPSFLIETAKKISEIKNIDLNALIDTTSQNAENLFYI